MLTESGWATVGPFFHTALPWSGGHILARDGVPGERLTISGRVLDGADAPVPDAMIEAWQANDAGRYRHPEDDRDSTFDGFGRTAADADGRFTFETIRPGRVPGPGNTLQAPHIAISIFGRGLARRVVTRIYFAGDPANADDPVLELVPSERRETLLAVLDAGLWHWTVRLQGARETVFFAL